MATQRENLKHEKQITVPGQDAASQMFGISLDQLMGEDGLSSGLPRVVKDCVDDIRARGKLSPLSLFTHSEFLSRRIRSRRSLSSFTELCHVATCQGGV